MNEIEALHAAITAAWDAYFSLVGREERHAGRGRDGHLNVDDLEVLRLALLKVRSFSPPFDATPKPPSTDKAWIEMEETDR